MINWCCLLILAVVLVLSGCVSKYPTDLKISRLSLAEVSTQTGKEIDSIRYVTGSGKFFRLKLDFTSREDLWKYARANNLVIDVNVYFCEEPDLNVLLKRGALYWKVHNLEEMRLRSDSLITPEVSGEIGYHVYFGIYSPPISSWKKNSNGGYENEYEAYDLVKDPRDVCVSIVGRTMVDSIESNILRIDKKVLLETLGNL